MLELSIALILRKPVTFMITFKPRRFKLVISIPAILTIALYLLGLIVGIFYSIVFMKGESGSGFTISIPLQTFILYILSLSMCCLLFYRFLKRKGY